MFSVLISLDEHLQALSDVRSRSCNSSATRRCVSRMVLRRTSVGCAVNTGLTSTAARAATISSGAAPDAARAATA
jgi:hypothetical protein